MFYKSEFLRRCRQSACTFLRAIKLFLFTFKPLRFHQLGLISFVLIVCLLGSAVKAATTYIPKTTIPLDNAAAWRLIEAVNIDLVRNIDFSEDGSVWIGSNNGLYHYDGFNLTQHKLKAKNDTSFYVAISKDGRVYAISDSSLFQYKEHKWQQLTYSFTSEDLAWGVSRQFAKSSNDALWFATGETLIRVHQSSIFESNKVGSSIQNILVDHEDNIWTLDRNNGAVKKFQYRHGKLILLKSWPQVLKHKSKSAYIYQSANKTIWVANSASQNGIKYLSNENSTWKPLNFDSSLGGNSHYSLTELSNGDMLVFGKSGFQIRHEDQWRFLSNKSLKYYDSRAMLYHASNENLWLVKPNQEIIRLDYDDTHNKHYIGLNFQCETADGTHYFLEKDKNVISYSPVSDSWIKHTKIDGLISDPQRLICQRGNRVWASGSHMGNAAISYIRGNSWNISTYPDIGSGFVSGAAYESLNGNLYFGAQNSKNTTILEIIPNNSEFIEKFYHVDDFIIKSISEIDNLIIAAGNKIIAKRNNIFEPFSIPEDKTSLQFQRLKRGTNNTLWAATKNRGVLRLTSGNWVHFTKSNGLSSNYLVDLVRLNNGSILALTDSGVDQFDGHGWHRYNIALEPGTHHQFNVLESSNGAIWLNNKVLYQTTQIYRNKYSPDTTVEISHYPQNHSQYVILSWSAYDYFSETQSSDLTFSYKINDGDWSPFDSLNKKLLENLKPGNYTIQVKARDTDGNVDPTPAQVSFEFHPSFWQSSRFIITIISITIVFILMTAMLVYQHISHKKNVYLSRYKFLSNVSNEFSPSISWILKPLETSVRQLENSHENIDYKTLRDSVNDAFRNTRRLNQLTEQFIDYRNLKNGEILYNPILSDLIPFVKMTVADFQAIAKSLGQTLRLGCPLDQYWTYFDPNILQKILSILITNALKQSDKDTQIKVVVQFQSSIKSSDSGVILKVMDEGEALDRSDLNQIFDPFSTSKSDSGIGIALVKALVEQQKGSIEVESPIFEVNDKSIGSQFILHFPKMTPATPKNVEKIIQPEEQTKYRDLITTGVEVETEKPLVLVFDNDTNLGRQLSNELKSYYNVVVASNAKTALQLSRSRIPDIIIADVVMPEMDSQLFCNELKRTTETSHIPVILQTTTPAPEKQASQYEVGNIDYIGKPISINLLKSRIRNHLAARERFANFVSNQMKASQEAITERTREAPFIEKARLILSAHYQKPEFNTEEFADKIDMNYNVFYRKFSAIANLTPAEFIKQYRLEIAAGLIKQGYSIKETIKNSGFKETSTFNRAFKKYYKLTPSEYYARVKK